MKFLIGLFLLIPSIVFATPATFSFQPYSSASGSGNVATSCSVFKGTQYADGTFDIDSLTSYSLGKNTAQDITLLKKYDYKITCYQTTAPGTAVVVPMYINGSSTYTYPASSLLIRKGNEAM